MISRDSLKGITSVIAVGLAIFQIYFTAGFGIIDSQLLRTIHLGIVLALVFLYFPPKKLQEGEREHPGWLALDLVLICGAFATAYFLASDIDYYMERIRYVDPVSDAETVCATPPSCSCWKRRAGWRGCRWSSWRARSLPTALAGSICPASSGTTASPTRCSANSCIS